VTPALAAPPTARTCTHVAGGVWLAQGDGAGALSPAQPLTAVTIEDAIAAVADAERRQCRLLELGQLEPMSGALPA
jgi:hypothetical protein